VLALRRRSKSLLFDAGWIARCKSLDADDRRLNCFFARPRPDGPVDHAAAASERMLSKWFAFEWDEREPYQFKPRMSETSAKLELNVPETIVGVDARSAAC
jgi:hypothetical protein